MGACCHKPGKALFGGVSNELGSSFLGASAIGQTMTIRGKGFNKDNLLGRYCQHQVVISAVGRRAVPCSQKNGRLIDEVITGF